MNSQKSVMKPALILHAKLKYPHSLYVDSQGACKIVFVHAHTRAKAIDRMIDRKH